MSRYCQILGHDIHVKLLGSSITNTRVWRDEIFGPVLCITPFDTEEEAVELANATDYGLAAAVFSTSSEVCDRVSQQLKAGVVYVFKVDFSKILLK